eukprot:s366_g31.t1
MRGDDRVVDAAWVWQQLERKDVKELKLMLRPAGVDPAVLDRDRRWRKDELIKHLESDSLKQLQEGARADGEAWLRERLKNHGFASLRDICRLLEVESRKPGTKDWRHVDVLVENLEAKARQRRPGSEGPAAVLQIEKCCTDGDSSWVACFEVMCVLLEARASVDVEDVEGETPLMAAVRSGHRSTIRSLLDAQADPNLGTATNMSPLLFARENGLHDVVRRIAPSHAHDLRFIHIDFADDDFCGKARQKSAGSDVNCLGEWLRCYLGCYHYGSDDSTVKDSLVGVCDIASTDTAFAAILAERKVITWGDYAGDSSAVQDQLKEVQSVRGTTYAFAGLLSNGSVVSWGHQDLGGHSSQVQAQLRDVRCLFSTERAFAAVLANLCVVT